MPKGIYPKKITPTKERFERKISMEPMTGCWLWIGGQQKKGYGCIWHNNKVISASRVSWMIHNGNIPDNLFVLHHCDTPECVNPLHLFLGDVTDNYLDMVKKGRERPLHGEQHPCSRLTTEDIINIKKDDRDSREIAKQYGIGRTYVYGIKRGKTWKHLNGWHKVEGSEVEVED